MRRLFSVLALTLIAGAICPAAPAFAGTIVPIPEPTSMSLAAAAIAGAAVAYRFLRRK